MSDLYAGGAGMIAPSSLRKIIRRSIAGYFAPLIAAYRLCRRPSWDYAHQLRVVYRFAFGR